MAFRGSDFVKFGWETVERIWKILSGWEVGSLGKADWQDLQNLGRLG